MMSEQGISRRSFLSVLAAVFGCAAAGGYLVVEGADKNLLARLRRLFPGTSAAPRLGAAYIEAHPEEADPLALARAIAPGGRFKLWRASDQELVEAVRGRVRRDFQEERVVEVNQWILSATEARLLALAAL